MGGARTTRPQSTRIAESAGRIANLTSVLRNRADEAHRAEVRGDGPSEDRLREFADRLESVVADLEKAVGDE